MDGFLVLLCHDMDDLPVHLCASYDEAKSYAAYLKSDGMPTAYQREVFSTKCSAPNCVKVVEFKDGRPVNCNVIKSYTGVIAYTG